MATTFRQRSPGTILKHLAAYDPENMKDLLTDLMERHEGVSRTAAMELSVSPTVLQNLCAAMGVERNFRPIRHVSKQELITMVTKHRGARNPAARAMSIGQQRLTRLIAEYELEGMLPPSNHPYWEDLT